MQTTCNLFLIVMVDVFLFSLVRFYRFSAADCRSATERLFTERGVCGQRMWLGGEGAIASWF